MNILKHWRDHNWELADAETYRQAYEDFGGSVITHPGIISRVSELAGMDLTYWVVRESDRVVAAAPLWGKYVAGSKKALKKAGRKGILDMGNAEVILPIAPDAEVQIRYKAEFVSALHERQIVNLHRKDDLCISLVKGYQPGGFSKKFKYNLRREWRIFQEAGGEKRPIQDHKSDTIADIYCELFEKRWGFKPRGHTNIHVAIGALKPYMIGDVLYLHDKWAAIQLVYLVQSPQWVSVEYVNGGVDPELRKLSPGSVLSYLNTSTAQAIANQHGKSLRFSFGKSDGGYKDLWGNRTPVYQL